MRLLTAILLVFFTTPLFGFESNITEEEKRRVTNDILFKDLAVGEMMILATYHMCSIKGKFYISGLSSPKENYKSTSAEYPYLIVKRMPQFKVTIELMPPENGDKMEEDDYILKNECDAAFLKPFKDFNYGDKIPEDAFEVISVNGFTDARSLWKSFSE